MIKSFEEGSSKVKNMVDVQYQEVASEDMTSKLCNCYIPSMREPPFFPITGYVLLNRM